MSVVRLALALIGIVAGAGAASAVTLSFLTEENPPFNYTENGKVVGSTTEIVQLISTRAGHPASIEIMPWDDAFVRAQAKKNTCVFATARLENRERLFLWVGPLATNYWALFGKGDFAVPIRALKDLAPYRIGAVNRDAKGEFLRENAITNLKLVRDDRENPAKLLLPADNPDHIDLWISGLYAGRSIAKAASVADVKLVFLAKEEPLYLACNPQTDRAVVKALSDALETLRADGSLARINAQYEKKFVP
ncbi:MAG: transporter substrate-binding domain-containing protein [Casimicrobiaceae bacterium]